MPSIQKWVQQPPPPPPPRVFFPPLQPHARTPILFCPSDCCPHLDSCSPPRPIKVEALLHAQHPEMAQGPVPDESRHPRAEGTGKVDLA